MAMLWWSTGKDADRPIGKTKPAWRRMSVVIPVITLVLIFVCLALVAILSGWITIASAADTVQALLGLSGALLLVMAGIICRRIIILWRVRQNGKSGSKMHLRLSLIFVLLSVIPALIVVGFSVLFLNIALQGWFSNVVRTAIFQSNAVAGVYLQEHEQAIRHDALALRGYLDQNGALWYHDPALFQAKLADYASRHSIKEVVIFERSGYVLAKAHTGFNLRLEAEPPPSAFAKAIAGDIAIITSAQRDRVWALARLQRPIETYLYLGRGVDFRVLDHIERVKVAVDSYRDLEGRRSSIEVSFAALFLMITLLFVLGALWAGLSLSNSLAVPLSRVIDAADDMRAGKPHIRLEEGRQDNEIGILARAFNRMARQLGQKRKELLESNKELDVRIKFIQTVLGGVSAGVIGLDTDGRIDLANPASSHLLGVDLNRAKGGFLADTLPEFAPLLDQLTGNGAHGSAVVKRPRKAASGKMRPVDDSVEGEILFNRRKGTGKRHLLVRISSERFAATVTGYIITFDDVTELIQAQKNAAWAEIARRIAHEIKNPLTPIRLAAERLRRKYATQIHDGKQSFLECTATIERHSGELVRMVDQFSRFSRLPSPKFGNVDGESLCRQVLALQKIAHPHIDFSFMAQSDRGERKGKGSRAIALYCDAGLMARALTNLVKNSVEAIGAVPPPSAPVVKTPAVKTAAAKAPAAKAPVVKTPAVKTTGAKISLSLKRQDGHIMMDVCDNGPGFDGNDPLRFSEPYVTTRKDGTGLGLAIVRKIVEEHRGKLVLENLAGGGARARIALVDKQSSAAQKDDRPKR